MSKPVSPKTATKTSARPAPYVERPVDMHGIPVPDCKNGIHVTRLGTPCRCGDAGPTIHETPDVKLRAATPAPKASSGAKAAG